eukprot:TRINITY_DN12086_c0_g1_i2.p1 TRINITY_DN12086_c0_g1~~TRINITY_DN12086_c0_g1_i2.p1  ORF type:complete len:119 (+),score=30.83 TRINITY_DN12086_c0_g1_i2:3-359(+)
MGEQKVQHETREIPAESRDLMARIRNAICALQAKGWPIFIDTIRSVVTDSINHKIPTALMTRPESLSLYQAKLSTLLEKDQAVAMEDIGSISVSYTHLTLPTILLVQISVVAVSLKKK